MEDTGRILIVTQDFGGGTGRHLSSMIRRWEGSGWTVEVICQGAIDQTLTEDLAITPGPAPSALRMLRGFPVAHVRSFAQVRSQVASFQPDIVHCFFFWSFVYGRLLRRLDLVPALVENREDQGFNVRPWQYELLRRTSHVPDRVVCVSEAVRRVAVAREGLRTSAAVVIHNGIAPAAGALDPGAARRALGLHDDGLVVGMVANLNRRIKGVEYFIDAMPLVSHAVPGVQFIIFGDGQLRPELEARARAKGVASIVTFAGFRADVDRYYSAFDVSALTSLSEGLSITLLESMRNGIPVVATRVGGNPELVTNGETGFLVPPKDPAAFASRVCALLGDADLRRRMGDTARRVIAARFDADTVADTYLQLFRALRERPPHRR